MQSNILKIIILPALLLIVLSIIHYNNVQGEIDKLIDDRYAKTVERDKKQLMTLIAEKQENILTISLALAKYSAVKEALLSKNTTKLKLKDFSRTLKENTSLKNLWFQIISKDGTSLYRSFSKKHGDNLLNFRFDIKDAIQDPKIISTISVGKFDMTYKAIVPIYHNNEFIGLFESIAKFNSISKKMKKKGLESILLVDKKFKKQLTHAVSKKFIHDYYLANMYYDDACVSYIDKVTPLKLLEQTHNKYLINKEKNLLISSYSIRDSSQNDLAYFILFRALDHVDLSDIEQMKNNIYLLLGVILLILYILVYYVYRRIKHEEIEKKNKELEESIQLKNDVLEYVSLHDSLTSLPNRKLFKQQVTQLLTQNQSTDNLYVMHMGIDRLKEVNDMHGHATGNVVLQNTANILKESLPDALIARLTADEFAIALRTSKESNINDIMNKILKDVQTSQKVKNKKFSITVSIGLSKCIDESTNASILLRNANTAMYQAKKLGGNTYQVYTQEMTTNLLDKIKLANDLKHAIKNDEFEAYFQPQINVKTNSIIGMEALIRWIHPKLGIIYPDRFIPYAEESGLIIKIDQIMMRKSMQAVMNWQNTYEKNLKLSLNLSVIHLESNNFMQELKNILTETNFNPSNLELEILESQIMKDPASSIELLNELKELGISISIDDFGTGHSSLAILKKLPISKLKIDKSFIDNIPGEKDDIAIVQTIIALANALKLDLIAEGVETKEQKDFLLSNKCFNIQGYYYSKALSPKNFKEFMIKFPN